MAFLGVHFQSKSTPGNGILPSKLEVDLAPEIPKVCNHLHKDDAWIHKGTPPLVDSTESNRRVRVGPLVRSGEISTSLALSEALKEFLGARTAYRAPRLTVETGGRSRRE